MNKLLTIILIIILSFTLVGCNNSNDSKTKLEPIVATSNITSTDDTISLDIKITDEDSTLISAKAVLYKDDIIVDEVLLLEESNDISFDSLLFDSAYMIVVEVKCDLLDEFGVQDLRIVPKYISTLEEGYGRVADYNILFIGNSFTFYNDMPTMVMDIGLSNDLDIRVEQISYGGYSLSDYIEDGSDDLQEVIDKLGEREWDYVILQEHSSKPYYDKEEFLSSVDTLSQIIKDNGAEVILFSTWSYRDGSSKLSSTGLTYTEFYNALTSAYEEAAELSNTSIAPVGTAFYNLTMEQPEINLLVSDDFHPRVEGSYVTAYIFYTQIFGEENNNEYTPSGLSNETLIILREYAVEALNLS